MTQPDHVIITGGSSGIGLGLARACLTRGAHVTLIGRSLERLQLAQDRLVADIPGAEARIFIAAAHVENSVELAGAIKSAVARFGECRTLFTSAGMVLPERFEGMDSHDFDEQINVNLLGTANAVRCVLAPMIRHGGGTIVMIASAAALIGIHGYTAYCASKSGLIGLAEALRSEIEPRGVRLHLCFPPDTDTPQLAAELPRRSPEAIDVMGQVPPWPVEAVVERILSGIDRGQRDIHFGPKLTLLARFASVIKPVLYWWFGRGSRA